LFAISVGRKNENCDMDVSNSINDVARNRLRSNWVVEMHRLMLNEPIDHSEPEIRRGRARKYVFIIVLLALSGLALISLHKPTNASSTTEVVASKPDRGSLQSTDPTKLPCSMASAVEESKNWSPTTTATDLQESGFSMVETQNLGGEATLDYECAAGGQSLKVRGIWSMREHEWYLKKISRLPSG
jgi:hypothetical protein